MAPSSGSTPLGEHSFNHRIHLRISGGPDRSTRSLASRAGARSRRSNCTRRIQSASEAVAGAWAGRDVSAWRSVRSTPKRKIGLQGKMVKVTFQKSA